MAIHKRIGTIILSLCSGFCLGWMFISLIDPHIPSWLDWMIALLLTILAGLCARYYKNVSKVMQGSLYGTYYLVRGLSMFVGGFQNEYEIYIKVISGQRQNRWFYLYIFSMAILACLSIYIQQNMREFKYWWR